MEMPFSIYFSELLITMASGAVKEGRTEFPLAVVNEILKLAESEWFKDGAEENSQSFINAVQGIGKVLEAIRLNAEEET